MIEVTNLSKTFRVLEGKKGLVGAVKNLFSRDYRYVEAVKDISFTVQQGEMLGLIGPNGAGKSTTIKILAGILVPTSGKALVNGIEPYRFRQQNAMKVSVVFGQRTKLWWDLPCYESFELHRVMYRIPEKVYKQNLDEFMEFLELGEFWNRPVRQLSLGQRMRAEIAVSLLHNPEVIYLDEPTIGMDAVAKERIRQFLLNTNKARNITLIITSHDMADIEKLCSRVIIIDHGQIVYEGDFDEIRHRYGRERTMVVEFGEEYPVIELPYGTVIKDEGLKKSIRFLREQGTAIDLITALGKHYVIRDVSIQEAEIESIIREIYEVGT
ncbi:MAG TPA: ATP-binding cassette domain-containing protein [Limnochordia bacterium]|jgi:ABC-2 type transport system ATP-binding protein|nr:ATP-binding cassette domain-containing protein [Bacillota bacterium]HOB09845.1 ATP-binding cassette domain-containing protein [Limnochordia bacterium]HPZ31824.1 ATP-binding cassette domain-containing protein [Limnochordia bacterium]